jgi:hypothetical protein
MAVTKSFSTIHEENIPIPMELNVLVSIVEDGHLDPELMMSRLPRFVSVMSDKDRCSLKASSQ